MSNEQADLPRRGSRAHSREGTVLLDKDVNKWLFSRRLETTGPVALVPLHSRLAWGCLNPTANHPLILKVKGHCLVRLMTCILKKQGGGDQRETELWWLMPITSTLGKLKPENH